MPRLQVGRKTSLGVFSSRGISFESQAFNEKFAVHAQDTKFAYDVVHPRQMEYLMASRPVSFRIAEDWAWFSPGEHSLGAQA